MKTKLTFALALLIAAPVIARADEPVVSVKMQQAIAANLETFVGKKVLLKLSSGQEVEGIVKEVGGDTVHLAELTGSSFYDALVKIGDISALVYRTK